jgi:ABC-type dipeptide/oligopeptide/nickel transport system permease subunit
MFFFRRFFKFIWKDKITLCSAIIFLFWSFVGILAAIKNSEIPTELSKRLQPPSFSFSLFSNFESLLGYDGNGTSLSHLIFNGAKTSLAVSVSTVTLCVLIGVPLGALAGYKGGWVDILISRFIDILLAFPPLVLPIAMAAFFGAGFWNVVFALSIGGWVSYARVVRGQVMSLRQREFVVAAHSQGASSFRILFKHILPNTLSPLAVQATFSLAGVILAEAGLSFLGLGVSQNYVSWGGILNDSRGFLTEAPFLVIITSFALFSVVASLNFLGESLRLALDSKSI